MQDNFILVGSGRLSFQVAEQIRQIPEFDRYNLFSYCRFSDKFKTTPFQRIFSFPRNFSFAIAVGNPSQRKNEVSFISNLGLVSTPLNIISNDSYVSQSSNIAKNAGIIALPGAIISTNSKIDPFVLISSGSIIEHDSVVSEFCTIGSGAVLCGGIKIGCHSFVGANSTIIQSLSVGSNSIIGAGAVVLKDVGDDYLAIGNPSRHLKRKNTECNPL